MKKIYLILLLIATVSLAAVAVKNITTGTSYRLTASDSETLINFNPPPSTTTFRIVIPLESATRDTFTVGTRVYGSSLVDKPMLISCDAGVTIINPDNAFRTKHLGSKWALTKIKRNVWLLEGDLYSTEIDAYVGDDVTIKAEVDPNATGPFVFTWYKGGAALIGQTNASLKLSNIKITDSGNYKVDVNNNIGYSSSEITNLIVR
jgi:hypothetical protein